MTSALSRIVWATSIVVALGFTAQLHGDEQQPIKITLHPMAESSPALKYRLLPKATDQTSGNAAVPYGKVTAEEMTYFKKDAFTDVIDAWQEMPLDKLRKENIPLPSGSILFLEQGAKCKNCDWQLPIGQIPFYTIQLPDAQQSRSYARILAVKARIEIANGKFDDAIKTFQTNYALARNVARGETLINGLVGIAIGYVMFPQITEYVQQPEAPNLYWALTSLPSPLITMADAVDVESQGLELSFPNLSDPENAKYSPKEWRDLFNHFANQVMEWNTNSPSVTPKTPEELDKLCGESAPAARRTLIAAGMSAEKVNAMPVQQVAMIQTLRAYHILFDEAAEHYSLPYPQATKGIEATIERAKNPTDENREIIPITGHTLLALHATRRAIARNDCQIALLRLFEALRIYAAAHDGQLPQQLTDIIEVPIPDNPLTGKPFVFRRDADKAFVEGPAIYDPLNYEITMADSK